MNQKFFLPLILIIATSSTQAVVKIQFFGMNTMLNVISREANGPFDSDPVNLFNVMNVPIQNSFLGPGKSVVSADRKFNFVCGVQGNENKCSAIIQQGPATTANPFNKTLTYDVTGAEAKALADKFFMKSDGTSLHFVSEDQQLRLDITENHFRLHFQAHN